MSRRGSLAPLRGKFFGTFDRAIASWSLLFSIMSLLLTIFLVKIPGTGVPFFIVVRDVTIVLALLCLTAFLFIKYTRRETTIQDQFETIQNQISILSNQFKNSHELVHNYRDNIFGYYFNHLQPYRLTQQEKKLFHKICSYTTTGLRKSLVEYFDSRGIDIGNDITVSVKLIVTPEQLFNTFPGLARDKKRQLRKRESWIITLYRDYYTHTQRQEREKAGRIYDINKNTAYHNIINLGEPNFLSNDLERMGRNYLNENIRWKEQYNSTLVVPIRYKSDVDSKYICYGLLAVDSLNKERRELYDQECVHILGHAADLMATFFLTLTLSQCNLMQQGP